MRYALLVLTCFFSVHISLSQTLVLPGDYPDPSVVKIGDSFWASATTSNWAPVYPILESKDLITWQPKAFVFNQLPSWADYYFWAPEISYDNGKVYVYYAAHKRDGNLCVGVASADKPEGPYKDHGPLMCQEAGSIDAFPMRDENGKLYLIWKEDGNSVNKPTPIWMMELNEERTALVGEKKELFKNDQAWEGNLVEGVSIMKHGNYFYAFYSAAGCCGRSCTYGLGVARAEKLAGPWEKYDKNPLLKTNKEWKCPGHGTPVEKEGKFYFLFHAYHGKSDVYVGRQGVLSEFKFTPDNWIEFLSEPVGPGSIPSAIVDEFNGNALSPHWQWSVFQKIKYNVAQGKLQLTASPEISGAFAGQKIFTGDYEAETLVQLKSSSAEAGLALVGDEKNFVSASVFGNKLSVKSVEAGKEKIVSEATIKPTDKIHFRLKVREGKNIVFSYSIDGEKFIALNKAPVDGFFLPPWDRAVRVALLAKGKTSTGAVFENFKLKNE
jgi:xylan 1,4-beta-xylosidase